MALIQCPGCGHKVSDRAAQCPKCETIINQEIYSSVNQTVKVGGMVGMILAAVAAAAVIVAVVLKATGVI